MKQKHIEHLEDLIFDQPLLFGAALRELNASNPRVSLKVDGSPCIFFGLEKGVPFISTKSFLNKKRVKCESVEEIVEAGFPKEVQAKLISIWPSVKEMLENFSKSKIEEVVSVNISQTFEKTEHKGELPQVMKDNVVFSADLLWHDHGYSVIEKNRIRVFANTLVYELSDYGIACEIGMAIHPGLYVQHLKHSNIYNVDLTVEKFECNLSLAFGNALKDHISQLRMPGGFIKYFKQWSNQAELSFEDFVTYKIHKHIDTLKTPDAKRRWHFNLLDIREFWNNHRASILTAYFSIQNEKNTLINNIVPVQNIKTYVYRADGDRIDTAHEGFVIKTNFGLVKLVDRNAFSAFNKSNEIKKAFDR